MNLKKFTAVMAAAVKLCPAVMANGAEPYYICAYYAGDGSLISAETADSQLSEERLADILGEKAPRGTSSGAVYRWNSLLEPVAEPITEDFTNRVGDDGAFRAPNVTPEMCRLDFWLEKGAVSDEVIMTGEEIAAYNRAILDTKATNTNDLAALPETYDGRSMADSMAGFESPKNLYIDGQPVSEEYYEAIRENIRNAAVSESMELKYGVAVNRTVMKAYPYAELL